VISHWGPARRLKPVNTGSLKRAVEALKNDEKNPDPDPHYML